MFDYEFASAIYLELVRLITLWLGMSAEDVHVNRYLQEINRLDLEIKACIQDVKDYGTSTEILDDLNSQIREKFSHLRCKIEDLNKFGKEQDKEADRKAILQDVENHRDRLANTITSLRQANLSAQLAIDKKEKETLISGGSNVRQRKINNKDILAKTAGNITESLISLNRTMANQVQFSGQVNERLVTSSGTVTETNEELKGMSGHIQNSRKLLTKYGRREFTDKMLIFLAIVFFYASVLYVVKKRLWPS